jgi:hypothetical protein
MTRRRVRAPRDDDEMAVAIALLEALLNAEVLPSVPCDFTGCKDAGVQYRNGAWCHRHLPVMEYRS